MPVGRVAVLRLVSSALLLAVVGLAAVLGVSSADETLGGRHERGPVVEGRASLVQTEAAQRELEATQIKTAPRAVEQPTSPDRSPTEDPDGQLIDRLTTPFARSYLQDDGTVVSRISATPVNFRDGQGDWRKIDDRLVANADGVRVAADRYELQLPESLADGPVELSGDGGGVSFQLDGASDAAGTTSGSTQTYADVLPGASVTYRATPRGVSETLTIEDASAPQTFTYSLSLAGGLTPEQRADGSIVFRDDEGRTRFSIAPAYMYDDAAAQGPNLSAGDSHVVPMQIARDGEEWRLTLTPDRAWVLDRLADGPVHVDPEWGFDDDGADCRIDETNPTTSYCGSTNLEVGWNGTKDHRSLLYFDLGSIMPNDAIVTQATMWMYLYSHSTSTAKQVGVYRATQPWTSSATWNKYDSTHSWTAAGGDSSSTYGAVTAGIGTANGWTAWYPTQIVQQWADGSQPNRGFLVKDAQSSVNNDLNFRSGSYGDDDYWPELDVTWRLRAGDRPSYTFIRQQLNERTDIGVNVANGNLLLHSQDMHIAGTAGYDLSFDRYYNSLLQKIGYTGSQGAGATTGLGLDRWVRGFDDGSVEVFMGDGSINVFIPNGSGGYQTPAGFHAKLVQGGGGAFTLTFDETGEQWIFGNGIDTEITQIKDRFGNTIVNDHRAGGSVSGWTDTQGRDVDVDTDAYGNRYVTHFEDSTGRDWTYGFDGGYTHLTTYTDPDSNTTSYGYDGSGRLTSITLPSGNVTNFTYDGSTGRVASIVRTTNVGHTTGPTTSFTYGSGSPCAAGEAKTIVSDPVANGSNGHTTTYCTDSRDRVTKTVDSDSNVRTYTYTANDDVATETPASGATTTYGYDALDNLISVQKGGSHGPTTTIAYTDGNDPHLPTEHTDPQGNYLDRTYAGSSDPDGPEGALLQIDTDVQSPGVQTNYTYNADGTLDTSTDGNGNVTTYGYDADGNLTSITPPGSSGLGVETIAVDSLSRAHVITKHVTSTVTRSQTITYDLFDRVTQVDYANSNSTGAFSVTYSYDDDGNMTSRVDPQGTTAYTFDKLNRVTGENPPGAADNTYGYDDASNLTSFTDGSGTTNYHYNGLNQYDSMTEPGDGSSTTFTYDANGQLTKTTYPGGVTLSRSYDSNTGQLTGITNRKPPAPSGTIFSQFTFDYSIGSGKGDVVQSTAASDGTNTNSTAYTYDALNRLTGAVTTGPTVNQYFAYTMDANGNRTRQVVNLAGSTSGGATTTSYAYNAGNQLCWKYTGTSANACGSPPGGSTTYTYNEAGDETGSSDGRSFSYNNAGQTTSITPAGGSATGHSYLGTTQDELTAVGSTALQNSTLGSSSTTTGGNTTYYGRTPDGTLVDERGPSVRSWYVFGGDVVDSVQGLVNGSTGNWNVSRTYTPYGETNATSGSGTNPFWFAAGYQGAGGLYHFGARHYDPSLGRWTQQDPLMQYTDLRQANRYSYVGNDPVSFTDPSGEGLFSAVKFIVTQTVKVAKKVGVKTTFKWIARTYSSATCGWGASALTSSNYSGWLLIDTIFSCSTIR